jgi:hypothetical protein
MPHKTKNEARVTPSRAGLFFERDSYKTWPLETLAATTTRSANRTGRWAAAGRPAHRPREASCPLGGACRRRRRCPRGARITRRASVPWPSGGCPGARSEFSILQIRLLGVHPLQDGLPHEVLAGPAGEGHSHRERALPPIHTDSTGNPQRNPACPQEKMHYPQVVLLHLIGDRAYGIGDTFPCPGPGSFYTCGAALQKREDAMPAGSGSPPVWLRVCAWCGISLAGDAMTPESPGGSALVTHGICPGCREEFIRAVAAEKEAARSAGPPAGGAC